MHKTKQPPPTNYTFFTIDKKKQLPCRKKLVSLHPILRKKQALQGSIAQSVQSICLTSRGSLVRIQLLPQQEQQEKSSAVFFLHDNR